MKGHKGYFQFKQFGVWHEKSAMKVSTDAVVLGALAGSKSEFERIFEIGLGTGVIALMLAQRFPHSAIQGVEIDQDAFEEAKENATNSPFGPRIDFKHTSIQRFLEQTQPSSVDLLVSNPPYFPDHLKSPDSKRRLALHTDSLSFEELLQAAAFLLHDTGEFWVILPERQMLDFIELSKAYGFHHFSSIVLKDQSDKPTLRMVCAFSKIEMSSTTAELSIKDHSGEYSKAYAQLLRDFLLIF